MSDKFFDWLSRKYGLWEAKFRELDDESRENLIREYCSIANWR